jgi:HlyD family secretion protein
MRLSFASVSLLALSLALPALPGLADTAAAPATPTAAAPAASDLPSISVVAVASRHMQDHVLASGLVAPLETVYVAPLIEGQQIEALLADVGDSVTQGQVLAKLSQASLSLQKAQLQASEAAAKASIAQAEATLISAKSSAADAQRNADRTAKLMAAGSATSVANDNAQSAMVSSQAQVAVATQTVEATKAQLTLVQAQMSNIDLQLSRTQVVAPVAGVITARNAQLGAIASAAGQPMFSMIRDGALELRADVAEGDLNRLAPGQTAQLTLAATGQTVTGTVRLVEPTIDTATRLGHARIRFADSNSVRSGMYVEASVLVAERDTLALPVTAVGSEAGQSTVMTVKDGVIHRTVVQTGISDGAWIEIVSGLAAGDQVVAKAGAFVSDGDKINPVAAVTN